MAKKKQTPEDLLKIRIAELTREFADWDHIKAEGCNDPFWPDGSNMNLVHNHIIYHKNEIEKICTENGLDLPEIYYKETPPEVDQHYMARGYLDEHEKPVREYLMEGDHLPKQTYYTKCGREFQKNSTAVVTGYDIDINDPECADCPFQVDVKEGWPQVHKKWECRAGSQPPNHATEWTGSLMDKNSIQIHSLDVALMEQIIVYCEAHPDLGAGYNTDHLADCRRTLSVCCSPNKKGIAAKRELIEKFFPEEKTGCCPYYIANNGLEIKCGDNVILSFKTRPEEFKPHLDMCRSNYTDCRAYIMKTLEGMGVDMKQKSWSTEEAAAELAKLTKKDDKEVLPEACQSCDFRPVKGKTQCNCRYVDKKADGKCGWFRNTAAGEYGDLIYEEEYGEPKPGNQEVTEDMKIEQKPSGNDTFLPENVTKNDEIVIFDYSSVDDETAEFLIEKQNNIMRIKTMSMLAVAKELKEAQDKLSNHNQGTFISWCESVGYPKSTAYDHLRAYEWVVRNSDNGIDFEGMQKSLLLSVSKPSARPELQQAVLTGDIKTHKEYKELEEKLREAEFHYETVQNSYKRLEKVNSEHYKLRTIAEDQVKELKNQLRQANSSSDIEKIKELDQSIREKQQEIEDLRQQLRDKPIEATASTIVEVIPENVEITQYHLKNYAKVNTVLEMVENLTTEEMQSWAKMMNDRNAVNDADRDCWLEVLTTVLQNLQDMEDDYRQGGYGS